MNELIYFTNATGKRRESVDVVCSLYGQVLKDYFHATVTLSGNSARETFLALSLGGRVFAIFFANSPLTVLGMFFCPTIVICYECKYKTFIIKDKDSTPKTFPIFKRLDLREYIAIIVQALNHFSDQQNIR